MGEVFSGRYELIDMIGEGGMGGVWRAYDLRDGSVVAAKVLRQSDAGSLLRFMREQGMRIHHPNVVTPLGWAGADDRVLLTMPLVEGGSLAGLSKQHGALPPLYVAEVMRQLLGALAAVHEQRVVHRDIKPANCLMSASGTDKPHLWLTDFGIAISMDAPRLTSQNIVMGTPGYLAPEQMRGYDLDARSDLYAAGMVGIQLLTGHKPSANTRTSPDDLPPRPHGVPDSLWWALVALAHPDIDERPPTALVAQDALSAPELAWQPQQTIRIDSVLDEITDAPTGEFHTSATAVRRKDPQRRARLQRVAVLVGAPLLAVAAIAGIWTFGGDDGTGGAPGKARLGAQCAWADVGTVENDQDGVQRLCQESGGSYTWVALPGGFTAQSGGDQNDG